MKHCFGYSYSLILLVGIITYSCKKENKIYPKVEITSPNTGASYQFNDTIHLVAKVQDANGSYSVNLLDGNTLIPLSGRITYSYANDLEYDVFLKNKYLASGTYDLLLEAYNGENKGSDFIQINYKELMLKIRGVVALSHKGNNATLLKYDSLGSLSQLDLNGDYQYLAVNSKNGFFATAGPETGVLKGYDFTSFDQQFQVSTSGIGGTQKYEALLNRQEGIFALQSNGMIKGYNVKGQVVQTLNLGSDYIPKIAAYGEPGLIVEAQVKGTNLYDLLLLNGDGSIFKKYNLPAPLNDIAYTGNSIYTLMYTKNGDLVVENYDYTVNGTYKVFTLQNQTGQKLLSISDTEVLLAGSEGIQLFNPQKVFLPSLLYNFAASDLALDREHHQVYYATGLSVVAAVPGDQPQLVFSANDSIRHIEIMYNK